MKIGIFNDEDRERKSLICSTHIQAFPDAMIYESFYSFYFMVKGFLGSLADQSKYLFMEIIGY